MFSKLFGRNAKAETPTAEPPGVEVTGVFPLVEATRNFVVGLLQTSGTLDEHDANLNGLRNVPLPDSYQRAGGEDAYIKLGAGRVSLWFRQAANGQPDAETMLMLRENNVTTAYSPTHVWYGPQAKFALAFKMPCCKGDNALIVFQQRVPDGSPVDRMKILPSAEGQVIGVSEHFSQRVDIKRVDPALLQEYYLHIAGIQHACSGAVTFGPQYRVS